MPCTMFSCSCRQCLEKENDDLQRNSVVNIWNKYLAAILSNFFPLLTIIIKRKAMMTENTPT